MNTPTPYDDEHDAHLAELAVMDLLRNHVPLSLLVDLAYPEGPRSSEILAAETA